MRQMTRRTVAMLAALSCALALFGCSGGSGSSTEEPQTTWQSAYNQGLKLLEDEDYAEAYEAFDEAVALDSEKPEALVGRGDATYLGLTVGSLDSDESFSPTLESARDDYLTAIELDDSDPEVYSKLADVYVELEDSDAALDILEVGYQKTEDEGLSLKIDEVKESSSDGDFWRPTTVDIYDSYDNKRKGFDYRYREDGYLEGYDEEYPYSGDWLKSSDEAHITVECVYDESAGTMTFNDSSLGPYEWNCEWTPGSRPTSAEEALFDESYYRYWVIYNPVEDAAYFTPGTAYVDLTCESDSYTVEEAEHTYTVTLTRDENGNVTYAETYDENGDLTGYINIAWEHYSASE